MLPETDLEYLLHGDPGFIETRLRRLRLLSEKGIAAPEGIRTLIAAVQARYDPDDTGPSYVHSLASELFDQGLLNEDALDLHRRGKRSYMERWADFEYMKWIGEMDRYTT